MFKRTAVPPVGSSEHQARQPLNMALGVKHERRNNLEPHMPISSRVSNVALDISLALLLCSWSATLWAAQQRPEMVSMLQLIATPEKFDGKLVQVVGYLRIDFEENALYFHKEDYEHLIVNNGVWLHLGKEVCQKPVDLNLKYVKVVGRFDAEHGGHMDLYSGSISNITECSSWFNRKRKPYGATPN
jgi:hypothetical protein